MMELAAAGFTGRKSLNLQDRGANGNLPMRSKKYSVGKDIGGSVYVHRNYESSLPPIVLQLKANLNRHFDYTIVKYSEKSQVVSFIECTDFDTADEPTVGEIATVASDGTVKRRAQLVDPYIYHHKWLFVGDDYSGFDVEASKARSRRWLSLSDIDKQRIGRKSYWDQYVVPRIEAMDATWLNSTAMASKLRISACTLSHLRNAGKLRFKKQGNAFFYLEEGFESDD